MKCPIDGTELKMSERQGIEIDYCPKCRGVWLDRGELDKIIERASAELSSSDPQLEEDNRGSPIGGIGRPMRDTSLRNPDEELLRAKKRERERADELERELERERARLRDKEREWERDRERSRDKDRDRYDRDYRDRDRYDDKRYYKKKKRKSVLGEIFDIFD